MKTKTVNDESVRSRSVRRLVVSLTLLLLWMSTGASIREPQHQANYPALTKLCPGRGGVIFYPGRGITVQHDQPRPEPRMITMYVVPAGEPIGSGMAVGSVKEAVAYQVVYPPGHKNYSAPTTPVGPVGRFGFSLPTNLPAHLLNRPVQVRFEPGIRPLTPFAATYTINPANCP